MDSERLRASGPVVSGAAWSIMAGGDVRFRGLSRLWSIAGHHDSGDGGAFGGIRVGTGDGVTRHGALGALGAFGALGALGSVGRGRRRAFGGIGTGWQREASSWSVGGDVGRREVSWGVTVVEYSGASWGGSFGASLCVV